jgi:DNA-directed RNA polymerase specialized sigma24 family protein
VTLRPFEHVYEEHGAAVLRVCLAVLGPADAEDAAAETFLAALRAYPRLRAGSNVRGWLATIAHRKAIDRVRARKRAPRGLDRGDDVPAPSPRGGPDPDLGRALLALPFKQRAAVTYHHLAGLPYAQVGALLGTSAAAARRSAADGVARLRERLFKESPS